MEGYRWLRYGSGIGLVLYNALMMAWFVYLGAAVVASCISLSVFVDAGECLVQLGSGKVSLMLFPVVNAVLFIAFTSSFAWARLSEGGRKEIAIGEDSRAPTPIAPRMDDGDELFEPPSAI